MNVLICCDNKGCFETTKALLNVNTNEVICLKCNKPIKSVTSFMKVQLKSLGQTMKSQKKNKAFSVECTECGSHNKPKVMKDGTIICSTCNKVMNNLPPPIANMLRIMK